ncbi:MAG: LysR family transcriptional regulator [Pseudomonadota bacterium]
MYGYLKHLANFAHVVEAGSITGAANKLGYSPSTLSESVKVLETYFREPLLERRQRGVFPTSKGSTIYEDCQVIVQSYNRAVQSSTTDLSGSVKVSMPSEFLVSFGALLIKRLRDVAPDIQLVLAAEDQVLDYTKYARDLYVRVGKEHQQPVGLKMLQSMPEGVVLIGASGLLRNHDIDDPDQIKSLTYLAGLSSKREQVLRLSNPDREITFQDTIQVGSTDARIVLMRQKVGITACLRSTVGGEIQEGDLVPLLSKQFGFPMQVMIGSPHKNPSAPSRLVAEVFREIHASC